MYVNADLGESFGIWKMGDDETVMPLVDVANIACGFHASDPLNILKTLQLAKQNGTKICAHPSYPDLQGFGRRSLKVDAKELEAIILYQISALQGMAHTVGVQVQFVKPHGALYNDMMKDEQIFISIVNAIEKFDNSLGLFILEGETADIYRPIAQKYGIQIYGEKFADRGYGNDGKLLPRGSKGALIDDPKIIADNISRYKDADTVCLHSDHLPSIEALKLYRSRL